MVSLHQIINKPMSTRDMDYHKLTKFLILITSGISVRFFQAEEVRLCNASLEG
jgi:hypothetical protein